LRIFAVALTGIASILIFFFSTSDLDEDVNVRFSSGSSDDEMPVLRRRDRVMQDMPVGGRIAVVLQQSPVDQSNQKLRLEAIDSGWASWTNSNPANHRVSVYAAIPRRILDSSSGPPFWKHIKPIPLYIPSSEADPRPDQNMIRSFLSMAASESNLQWLIFANDHTFMIPVNLVCFLNQLDADIPVYSGNKLYRGPHRDFKLYFASGGSGVVLSHVSLKLLLVSWTITGNPDLERALLSEEKFTHGCNVTSIDLIDFQRFSCTLLSIIKFLDPLSLMSDKAKVRLIKISTEHSLCSQSDFAFITRR
jgi:hypothetical protein